MEPSVNCSTVASPALSVVWQRYCGLDPSLCNPEEEAFQGSLH